MTGGLSEKYIRVSPIIGELCGLLRHQAKTTGPFTVSLVSGLGAALATQLMASHFRQDQSRHPQHWLLPRPVLADLCAYIDLHLTEKLTLSQLAKVAGLSPSYFGQMFRAALGMAPMTYVLDQPGGPNHVGNFCDAPVIVDTNTKEIRTSAAFYYLGHFSKFVKPGAHRIASAGGPAGLDSIAFANPDGSLVTVVLNSNDTPMSFDLTAAGDTLRCSIPARAIQTYVRRVR